MDTSILLLVGLILLALLIGVLIPVLVQFRSTLRSTEQWLDRVGPKLDRTLVEVQEASRKINRAGGDLEQGTKRAQSLLQAAGEIGETLQTMNKSFRTAAAVGSAVGPAMAAAVRAFTDAGGAAQADSTPPPRPSGSPEPVPTSRDVKSRTEEIQK